MNWGMLRFYPNLYIILVGPSGVRKGTAMGPALDMLKEIGVKLASEAITREALIRELKESNDTQVNPSTGEVHLHASLTIFSPELTVFLGYQNKQLMSDLCDWYDCRDSWKYRTKNQGTDDINGVWVNIVGGTTPELLQTTMPIEAIGSGLTSRMLFVYAERKDKKVIFPSGDSSLRKKLIIGLEKMRMLSGEFKVTGGFMDTYGDWYLKEDKPPFDDHRFSGYFERRPNHLLKLSMICNVSRTSTKILEKDDFRQALTYLKSIEQKMPLTFRGVGKSNMADVLTRLLTMLRLNGEMHINEIMTRFYQDADSQSMKHILATLNEMGEIKMIVRGETDILVVHKSRYDEVYSHKKDVKILEVIK
ncbi:Primase C-terminal 1 domain-containing protein [Azospirillaceae bacterium]